MGRTIEEGMNFVNSQFILANPPDGDHLIVETMISNNPDIDFEGEESLIKIQKIILGRTTIELDFLLLPEKLRLLADQIEQSIKSALEDQKHYFGNQE